MTWNDVEWKGSERMGREWIIPERKGVDWRGLA